MNELIKITQAVIGDENVNSYSATVWLEVYGVTL